MKSKIKWNLGLLYKSLEDPQIEKDIEEIEKLHESFAKRYDVPDKKYLVDKKALLESLFEYEAMQTVMVDLKPLVYFSCLKDIDSKNLIAVSKLSLISDRLNKSENKILFYKNSIGKIENSLQDSIMKDEAFSHFKFFLSKVFDDAKYRLSVPEEKILNLKSLTSYDMWVMMNQRILSNVKILWKNKNIPYSEASDLISSLKSQKDREKLSKLIANSLKEIASVSEAEINAVVTNKKINDALSGYKEPYDSRVRSYRNKPETVINLIEQVKSAYKISHRFYKLKAKLLKKNKINYYDRNIGFGEIKQKFDFNKSLEILRKCFGSLNPVYEKCLVDYVNNGQIDTHPRFGKVGGAYCRGSYVEPSYILLNHSDDFRSFKTLAHEMGHAFHTLLSRSQDVIYSGYSISLAETASTLFESLALESVMDTLSPKEKISALHGKINAEIATIFRQVACFDYELEIHNTIRKNGFMSAEELALAHNKHMGAYLGPSVKLEKDDGYFFIGWTHIRRFFYVYSYAFGLLVSKALIRRYKKDKSFWTSIEKFLSSGGKDTPENILLEIGIDVSKPDFWKEGLDEIESDIDKLEKLLTEVQPQ
jgi:oligoendopeptidase F